MPFVITGGGTPPIVSQLTATFQKNASGTNLTTGALNIGAAQADRLVVVVLNERRDAATTITSATIGGVAATVSPNVGGKSTTNLFLLWASVPSGTTAAVVVNFDQSGPCCVGAVYTITGQVSDTPVINTGLIETAGTARSTTQTIPARSVTIAGDGCANNAYTTAWSGSMGLVEDTDFQFNNGGAYSNMSTASLVNNGGSLGSVTATATKSAAPTTPKFALATWQ